MMKERDIIRLLKQEIGKRLTTEYKNERELTEEIWRSGILNDPRVDFEKLELYIKLILACHSIPLPVEKKKDYYVLHSGFSVKIVKPSTKTMREVQQELEDILSDGYWHTEEELKEKIAERPYQLFYESHIDSKYFRALSNLQKSGKIESTTVDAYCIFKDRIWLDLYKLRDGRRRGA